MKIIRKIRILCIQYLNSLRERSLFKTLIIKLFLMKNGVSPTVKSFRNDDSKQKDREISIRIFAKIGIEISLFWSRLRWHIDIFCVQNWLNVIRQGQTHPVRAVDRINLSRRWPLMDSPVPILMPEYSQSMNSQLSLIHIWRCRRSTLCRSRWSPYH